ncbi:hypothetical protein TELCIR_13983, partial [Teladorsagia circumcincta]
CSEYTIISVVIKSNNREYFEYREPGFIENDEDADLLEGTRVGMYQLAQGALQLTGTGVGVLNQASEGNWFPAALETASKNTKLPQGVEEQTDSDYIDELAPDRGSAANSLRLRNSVPNLPKLIEVLRKSKLKDSDIAEIISQIEDNENVPSPPKIDFTSAVQNIPLKKHQNRERIVKASRELQRNIGAPEQGINNNFNQLGQLPDLSTPSTGVPPTVTFQPPSTATLPGLDHLFPHITQPTPDPIASNRLQREIASVPTDKPPHQLPVASSTPGVLLAQPQFTTPSNFVGFTPHISQPDVKSRFDLPLLFHHQHWPHPHYPTQYNAVQPPSPAYQPHHSFIHPPLHPFQPYQHYQVQQQQQQ